MSDSDYIKQLEETIESLKQKLDETSYFKPMWSYEIVPGHGNGKMLVLQLQGNPVGSMYEKKVKGYIRGSPKQRSRWARATIEKEVLGVIRITTGRFVPYVLGKECEWEDSLDDAKRAVNKMLFGVSDI